MKDKEVGAKIINLQETIPEEQFVFMHDIRDGKSTWSRKTIDYFELSGANAIDTIEEFTRLVHPEDVERWKREVDEAFSLRSKDLFSTFNIKNKQGNYVRCTMKGKVIIAENGEPAFYTGSLTVHGNELAKDIVTDLPKLQMYLNDVHSVKCSRRECLTMAIEVRKFHNINNLCGHNFGNKVLYELAQYMVEQMGNYGRVYRMDGTIFTFLFNDSDVEHAESVFKKIREECAKFELDGRMLNLQIAGGALYTKNPASGSNVILSSLLAILEKAKDADSYELQLSNDEMQASDNANIKMLNEIKTSIQNGCEGFYICYQPFVSTMTGKIIGAEALVRWKNDAYGEVAPGRFIPQLELHPSFYELGLWILRTAVRDAKKLLDKIPEFFINVNMSYSQLERGCFKHEVVRILEEEDFPKSHLQLELTERCRNLDMRYLKEQLEFFRSHDIRIALDDFGTGNSTINLLCDLPINCVKIDQTFILHILDQSNNQIVVNSTVQCAKQLGMDVCLEGVENGEIRDFIGRYSVNYHQGYFYSRPVRFESFMDFLSDTWRTDRINLIKEDSRDMFSANSIVSMIPGGFFIYTADDKERIISVNEILLEIFECDTLEEFYDLTGGSFKGIVHPEEYACIEKSINQQIANNNNNRDFVKYNIITKKGNVKKVRDYGHLVRNDNDVDVYYVFLVEDR